MELIHKYFPELPNSSIDQFKKLPDLYSFWNSRINVISRKDIQNLYLHHVLYSLSIAKQFPFKSGTRILDAGTGGGFPGIPLAIFYPEAEFTLADSIGKKVTVVKNITHDLGLKNTTVIKSRIEDINDSFEFIVSRAVTSIPKMIPWIRGLISHKNLHSFPNGMIYLKGGEVKSELGECTKNFVVFDVYKIFQEPYFETKKILYFTPETGKN